MMNLWQKGGVSSRFAFFVIENVFQRLRLRSLFLSVYKSNKRKRNQTKWNEGISPFSIGTFALSMFFFFTFSFTLSRTCKLGFWLQSIDMLIKSVLEFAVHMGLLGSCAT